MKIKNVTEFHINTLNQERLLNELCKKVKITRIERLDKQNLCFKCDYSERKFVEKFLKSKNAKIIKIKNEGLFPSIVNMCTSYGVILAVVIFSIFYIIQGQFVWQYDIRGVERVSQMEIMEFVKENFSLNKKDINTKQIESAIDDHFDEISFVSCIIKGQTLILNIKEKLLPDEKYGEFKPILAQKDAKITQINLVSGTLNVKVGQMVEKGDVLVKPFVMDSAGELKAVEASAQIFGEVYNIGEAEHYETIVSVERSGRVCEKNEIKLFGLTIYTFEDDCDFEMYEVEYADVELAENIVLPFKMHRTIIYELKEKTTHSKFEDVKEEYIQKAREKAFAFCENCDNIKEEFYTIRELSGVTIVNYCIVTLENIGGVYDS